MIKVIENFITPKEEQDILKHLKPSRVVTGFGRNRVYRYGSRLPYKAIVKPIPDWLDDLCMKVGLDWGLNLGFDAPTPDHVTINEYHAGQTIDWHIDSKESGPIITVLSIESDAVMGLKWTPEGEKQERSERIILPGRSLLHMTEEDRWNKQHCIYPVPSHRWSLVFRKGTDGKN